MGKEKVKAGLSLEWENIIDERYRLNKLNANNRKLKIEISRVQKREKCFFKIENDGLR